jgi:hypothetical protein
MTHSHKKHNDTSIKVREQQTQYCILSLLIDLFIENLLIYTVFHVAASSLVAKNKKIKLLFFFVHFVSE